MTQTAAVEFLLPLWQHVLQRPFINVNNNFFDFGGNPSLADRIFVEVAEACGRDLTSLLIYEAPTVALSQHCCNSATHRAFRHSC